MATNRDPRRFRPRFPFQATVFVSPSGIHTLDKINEELLGQVPEVFKIESALRNGEVKGKVYPINRDDPRWIKAAYG